MTARSLTTKDQKDLRIESYRCGGPGGLHVGRISSAVRITHIPTGIVVKCQSQRTMHRNKAEALDIMRARLDEHARRKHEDEK